MIKAVFFDFYNTLATHDPPREETYVKTCAELGIELKAKALFQSLPAADRYWRDENARKHLDQRTPEEKIEFYTEYAYRILTGAGANVSRDMALQMLAKLQKYKWTYRAYDDSLPTLKDLKKLGITIGLISNVVQDMDTIYDELGLKSLLTFKVTSAELGYDKPHPEIFQSALNKAEVKPQEAIHVGDQYDLDVIGAKGVGITAILIDRNNHFTEIKDCPRIQSLTQITKFI
jgi:putative hydrolase of the HAD superfamily